jgi:DNA-binding CsgD family transcriptional regulator/sugar-specific transcriptional regulator TrmB
MTETPMKSEPSVPGLGGLGFSAADEDAYRYLVAAGDARTPAQVARATGLPDPAVAHLLTTLEKRGLVSRHDTGYRASPPEVALGALLSERDQELDRIRLLTATLQGQYSESIRLRHTTEFVEVVRGQEQVNRYYLHLVREARTGLDVLTKPPYLAGPGQVGRTLDAMDAGIRRGVRTRSVYDGDALDEDGTLAIARQSMELGEEARAVGGLPFKLAIVDGRIGFMPLDIRFPALGALLVHASALLDALIAVFEGIWARAVPLQADRHAGPGELTPRAGDVLRLMAAGLKDEAIARALSLSRRTVQKHVSDIMTTLGARNRFQAALLARSRGWVG